MNQSPTPRLEALLAAIDRENAQDPVTEPDGHGGEAPRALLYGRRMSETLEGFRPDAGELLRAAVRAQHIRRWDIPRSDYPEGRQGYHRWRQDLAAFHARLTGELMGGLGYTGPEIERVGTLLRKEGLKSDPEVQTLEDVACLVFLRHYLADFAEGTAAHYDQAKHLHILRRTWAKMSDQGRAAALRLDLPSPVRALVEQAIAGER